MQKALKNKLYIAITFIAIITQSCTEKNISIGEDKELNLEAKSNELVEFTPLIKPLVDSFALAMKSYSKITNLLAYVQISEAKDNSSFKIIVTAINNPNLLSNKTISGYFIANNYIFCLDYNINTIINFKNNVDVKELIVKSGLDKNTTIDLNFPTWLIEINSSGAVTINKKAHSPFSPKCLNCPE